MQQHSTYRLPQLAPHTIHLKYAKKSRDRTWEADIACILPQLGVTGRRTLGCTWEADMVPWWHGGILSHGVQAVQEADTGAVDALCCVVNS